MRSRRLNSKFEDIYNSLFEGEIIKAISQLESEAQNHQQAELIYEIQVQKEIYNNMLLYTSKNIEDPDKERVYLKLREYLLNIADKLEYRIGIQYHNNFFSNQAQKIDSGTILSFNSIYELLDDIKNNPIEEEKHYKKEDQDRRFLGILQEMFYHAVFGKTIPTGFFESYESLSKEYQIVHDYTPTIISGLILGLLKSFDENKLKVLIRYGYDLKPRHYTYALDGIVLIKMWHNKRLQCHRSLAGDVSQLLHDRNELVAPILYNLEQAHHTQWAKEFMEEEILKDIQKISPKLKDEDFQALSDDDDENPVWKKIIEESSDFEEKMIYFSELEKEGIDVYYSTFSSQKHFPFFREISHWLLPFNQTFLPYTMPIPIDEISETIEKSHYLCDSDKYSFYYMLTQAPKSQQKELINNFKEEFSQHIEAEDEEKRLVPERESYKLSKQHIMDLYRIMHLYKGMDELSPMIDNAIHFNNLKQLKQYINKESVIKMADFYFNNKYYSEAADILQVLTKEDTDGIVTQKLGYCYQKQGEYKKAIKAYKRADILSEETVWINKKIGFCYRKIGNYKKAINWYQLAHKNNPQNVTTILAISSCYINLGQYKDALSILSEAYYTIGEDERIQRAIGWILFLKGDYKEALSYFKECKGENQWIIEEYLGHTYFCLGNWEESITHFKQAYKQSALERGEMFERLLKVKEIYINKGIDRTSVSLLYDILYAETKEESL